MNPIQSTFKIKYFILREYGMTINGEILNNILKEIFDINGNIINQDKYNIFDSINIMSYGIKFTEIMEIINKDEINILDKQDQTLIDKFKNVIEKKDNELSMLKEMNEELRTNYWNLKQLVNK